MAAAGTVAAAPFMKFRRLNLLRWATYLMSCPPPARVYRLRSIEPATLLNDLDLVTIGISGEEEPRKHAAVMLQFAQRTRRKIFALEASVLGCEVVHND